MIVPLGGRSIGIARTVVEEGEKECLSAEDGGNAAQVCTIRLPKLVDLLCEPPFFILTPRHEGH
jgi:hypothetical protein